MVGVTLDPTRKVITVTVDQGDVSAAAEFLGRLAGAAPAKPARGGAMVTGTPDQLRAALDRAYPGQAQNVVRSDPQIAAIVQLLAQPLPPGQTELTVFLPLPSALQPALETGERPQAPRAEDATPGTKSMPENPATKANSGVSMKPQAAPAAKPENTVEAKQAFFAPEAPGLVLLSAHGLSQSGLASDHKIYLSVRESLGETLHQAMATRDVPIDAPELQHLFDFGAKLDNAAREYFGKPAFQREVVLQRATFMALIAQGQSPTEAQAHMQEMLGKRFNLDMAHMNKLVQALPSHVFLELKRDRSLTGGKLGKKGGFDRIEGIDRGEKHDEPNDDEPTEQMQLPDDDEADT